MDEDFYEHPLREVRRRRGLTQILLARASGVGRVTINRIEMYKQRPHRSTAIKLARALDIEPREIASGFRDIDDHPPGVKLTPRLTEETMPHVRKVARKLARNPGDVEDLESAGREGLVEACRRFDPDLGTPLTKYARWIATNRVRDEARRLYRHPPGSDFTPGKEPFTY